MMTYRYVSILWTRFAGEHHLCFSLHRTLEEAEEYTRNHWTTFRDGIDFAAGFYNKEDQGVIQGFYAMSWARLKRWFICHELDFGKERAKTWYRQMLLKHRYYEKLAELKGGAQ